MQQEEPRRDQSRIENHKRRHLRARWVKYRPEDDESHPGFDIDKDVYTGNNFVAVENEAWAQRTEAQKSDIRAAGYHIVTLTDAHGRPVSGVVDQDKLLKRLEAVARQQGAASLHYNKYDPDQLHSDPGRLWARMLAAPPGKTASFKVPGKEAFAFTERQRREWHKYGHILGRKLIEDTIAQPPRGSLHYFIGEAGEVDLAHEAKISVHSGWNATDEATIEGVSTPFLYISSARGTASALHQEDWNLASANELWAGSSKIWIMICPEEREKFEAYMCDTWDLDKGACGQFARHHFSGLLTPELLEKAGIRFRQVQQLPGQIVVTLPATYHQVINQGPNIAVAVNLRLDWDGLQYDDNYRVCRRDRNGGCGTKQEVMTKECLDALERYRDVGKVEASLAWGDLQARQDHFDQHEGGYHRRAIQRPETAGHTGQEQVARLAQQLIEQLGITRACEVLEAAQKSAATAADLARSSQTGAFTIVQVRHDAADTASASFSAPAAAISHDRPASPTFSLPGTGDGDPCPSDHASLALRSAQVQGRDTGIEVSLGAEKGVDKQLDYGVARDEDVESLESLGELFSRAKQERAGRRSHGQEQPPVEPPAAQQLQEADGQDERRVAEDNGESQEQPPVEPPAAEQSQEADGQEERRAAEINGADEDPPTDHDSTEDDDSDHNDSNDPEYSEDGYCAKRPARRSARLSNKAQKTSADSTPGTAKAKPARSKPARKRTFAPLSFRAASDRLNSRIAAYNETRSKHGRRMLPGRMMEADHQDLLRSIEASTGRGDLFDLQVRLMKLALVIRFDKMIEDKVRRDAGHSATRTDSMRAKRVEVLKYGIIAEFLASLNREVNKKTRDQMGQWLNKGRNCRMVSGGTWEGRWVLALMAPGEMDQFPKRRADGEENPVDVWKRKWEDKQGFGRLKLVAERFLDAMEKGEQFEMPDDGFDDDDDESDEGGGGGGDGE